MVRNAIISSDQGMQYEEWQQDATGRDLRGQQDVKNLALSDALTAQAGGIEAEAKAEAKRVNLMWENKATLAQLKIQNLQAKNAKISAAANRAAMKTAVGLSGGKTKPVPVTTYWSR